MKADGIVSKECLFPEHIGSSVCDLEDFYIGKMGEVSDYCKRCERQRKRTAYWQKQGFDQPPSVDPVKAAMREAGLKLTDYCSICYAPIDKTKHRSYCYACTGAMQKVYTAMRSTDTDTKSTKD